MCCKGSQRQGKSELGIKNPLTNGTKQSLTMCTLHPAKHSYISERCHCIAGPPDGHLPDSADQDSAATAREAHVRFGESAQGIPEAPPRVVPLRRERRH